MTGMQNCQDSLPEVLRPDASTTGIRPERRVWLVPRKWLIQTFWAAPSGSGKIVSIIFNGHYRVKYRISPPVALRLHFEGMLPRIEVEHRLGISAIFLFASGWPVRAFEAGIFKCFPDVSPDYHPSCAVDYRYGIFNR